MENEDYEEIPYPIDEGQEPLQSEIEEYAEWLGADLKEDQDLFWIAREALKAPLPKGWKLYKRKGGTGEPFYFNSTTGESLWDHPLDQHYKDLFKQEKRKKLAKNKTALADRPQAALGKSKSQTKDTQEKIPESLQPQMLIPSMEELEKIRLHNEKEIELEKSRYKEKVEKLNEKLKQKERETEERIQELNTQLKKKQDSIQQELQDLQEDFQDRKLILQKKEGRLEMDEKSYQQRMHDLEEKERQLKRKTAEYEEKLSQLQKKKEKIDSETDKINEQIEQNEQKARDLIRQNIELDAQFKAAQKRKEELEKNSYQKIELSSFPRRRMEFNAAIPINIFPQQQPRLRLSRAVSKTVKARIPLFTYQVFDVANIKMKKIEPIPIQQPVSTVDIFPVEEEEESERIIARPQKIKSQIYKNKDKFDDSYSRMTESMQANYSGINEIAQSCKKLASEQHSALAQFTLEFQQNASKITRQFQSAISEAQTGYRSALSQYPIMAPIGYESQPIIFDEDDDTEQKIRNWRRKRNRV